MYYRYALNKKVFNQIVKRGEICAEWKSYHQNFELNVPGNKWIIYKNYRLKAFKTQKLFVFFTWKNDRLNDDELNDRKN